MRTVFVLLLALNLGVLAWIGLRPTASTEPAIAPLDPSWAPLVLLRERDAESMRRAAERRRAAEAQPRPPALCTRIGPFLLEREAETVLQRVVGSASAAQLRTEQARIVRGYWVYLPAYDSRDAALAAARQLSAAGVRDYYVVTTGEQENMISLGLFREAANAERRREQIAALGFPARLRERVDEQQQYWVDYRTAADAELPWQSFLVGVRSEVRAESTPCPG